MLTAPSTSREPEAGDVRLKDNARKRFRENVRCVFDTWSVLDDERTGFDVGANEMIADVDVLGFPVVGVVD